MREAVLPSKQTRNLASWKSSIRELASAASRNCSALWGDY